VNSYILLPILLIISMMELMGRDLVNCSGFVRKHIRKSNVVAPPSVPIHADDRVLIRSIGDR
jgi:hypothetical protein